MKHITDEILVIRVLSKTNEWDYSLFEWCIDNTQLFLFNYPKFANVSYKIERPWLQTFGVNSRHVADARCKLFYARINKKTHAIWGYVGAAYSSTAPWV